MKICSVINCNRKHYGRGYCSMHYYRLLRHGDINHQKTVTRKTIAERFTGKYAIDPDTGCWNWKAYKDSNGYGHISIGGKYNGDALAHRVSYELHVGKIPQGMNVLHSCDNPSCVCPQHLRIGTQLDNVQDMTKRERGNNWGHKKLSTTDVVQVLSRIAAGEKQSAVAKSFGVGESQISRIKLGKSRRSEQCV